MGLFGPHYVAMSTVNYSKFRTAEATAANKALGGSDFGLYDITVWCEQRHFLRHLCIKAIFLPRQAREKHRKICEKRDAFFAPPSQGGGQTRVQVVVADCGEVKGKSEKGE